MPAGVRCAEQTWTAPQYYRGCRMFASFRPRQRYVYRHNPLAGSGRSWDTFSVPVHSAHGYTHTYIYTSPARTAKPCQQQGKGTTSRVGPSLARAHKEEGQIMKRHRQRALQGVRGQPPCTGHVQKGVQASILTDSRPQEGRGHITGYHTNYTRVSPTELASTPRKQNTANTKHMYAL